MPSRKKILLVDDVELFLELSRSYFQREEFLLLVARNGVEALRLARVEHPDLVVMDLLMPEMAGDEACRRIKEDPELKATPVIMVTGREDAAALRRCEEAGCDAFVTKPIDRKVLLETAGRFLRIAERSASRVKTKLLIHFGLEPQRSLLDYSVNLSTGGIFIETPVMITVETPLTLEFFLPDNVKSVICKGRVAWVNPRDRRVHPTLPAGLGVQFLNLRDEDVEAIRHFLNHDCLPGSGGDSPTDPAQAASSSRS